MAINTYQTSYRHSCSHFSAGKIIIAISYSHPNSQVIIIIITSVIFFRTLQFSAFAKKKTNYVCTFSIRSKNHFQFQFKSSHICLVQTVQATIEMRNKKRTLFIPNASIWIIIPWIERKWTDKKLYNQSLKPNISRARSVIPLNFGRARKFDIKYK